ncbi:molybdenum cofactor biosynthesis protein [Thermotoga sp. Ku-13t]|uniref:MogA/MoaB family molybdenum cofactor biosynthesis protein n=1 Tax=Thermotoga sp. Ku-13t TaxID=1755813 RepID=UPI0013ECA588|nr:MogA/MoaB family molybdenum cofactor biosynthesis protein [Thermotoga sp. Ku-13t]KAF2958711.1 molybdenum cofactor biosynthesis protein [Thermotoga sp. Ku-13t]
MRVAVVVVSDRVSKGIMNDKNAGTVEELMNQIGARVEKRSVVPDEAELIRHELLKLSEEGFDVVVTCGGTGVSPRDVTPEATAQVIEKRLYGMEVAMMLEALKYTPTAMLSRAVVGVRKQTLIINLPGSPNAVQQNLKAILPAIPHAIEKIKGSTKDCHAPEGE